MVLSFAAQVAVRNAGGAGIVAAALRRRVWSERAGCLSAGPSSETQVIGGGFGEVVGRHNKSLQPTLLSRFFVR